MPALEPVSADAVLWEVVYDDDSTAKEGTIKYAEIDRTKLKTFRLLNGNGDVIWTRDAPNGNHPFVYRRRTTMNAVQKSVAFLVGWEPNNFWLVDADGNEEEVDFKVRPHHDYQVRQHENESVNAQLNRRNL